MKGLKDFMSEKPVHNFPILNPTLEKVGYSIKKVLEELEKEYKVILVETTKQGQYNSIENIISMRTLEGKEFYWFCISSNGIDNLNNIIRGLQDVPVQSYYDSKAYRTEKTLRDARAKASGFKDSSDMTRAYYDK